MSDLASSRPAPDEPPDPRPGGPADASGLFPSAAELFVPAAREPSDPFLPAAREPSDLDELAEVIADLADLRAPDRDTDPDKSDFAACMRDTPGSSRHDGFGAFSPDASGSPSDPYAHDPRNTHGGPESSDGFNSYDGFFDARSSHDGFFDARGAHDGPYEAHNTHGDPDSPDGRTLPDDHDHGGELPEFGFIDAMATDDTEPTARSIAALLNAPSTNPAELADAVAWCYDDAALPLLLPLARHPDPGVRRAVAQALPSVLGESPADDTVRALILLSADRDGDVRDWACFALGTQLSEVDSPTVRGALAARLDDPHDDTRCEALLGLARRRDTRVLSVLHERLARDNVYSLEIDAAGALGHASLHTLIRGHLSGWDDDVVARVCAALRLTDPDGVGDDLLDGLADWFRAGAPHATDEDRYWWSVTLQLLEHAEYRAPEIAEQVHYRLQSAELATALMLGSRLSQLAGDHGWPRWRPNY